MTTTHQIPTHLLLALLPLVLIALATDVYCLVDIARSTSTRGLPRWGWALACLVWWPVGVICYLVFGRNRDGRR